MTDYTYATAAALVTAIDAGAVSSETRTKLEKIVKDNIKDGTDGAKDMEVRFDPTYGYPNYMGISVEGVPDGTNFFKVEDLTPLR